MKPVRQLVHFHMFLGPDSRTYCQRTFTLHTYSFILKGNFKGKLMKAKILENSEIAL